MVSSQEMWSWINLTLEKSTSAQRTFHNVPELEGAELYRRLVVPLTEVSPTLTRHQALRTKVQNPTKAKSIATVMDAVTFWEADMLDIIKAGGVEPDDEDQRNQLILLMPKVTLETLEIAAMQPLAPALIAWLRKKAKFAQEHGGAEAHAAEAEVAALPPLPVTSGAMGISPLGSSRGASSSLFVLPPAGLAGCLWVLPSLVDTAILLLLLPWFFVQLMSVSARMRTCTQPLQIQGNGRC